MKVFNCVKIPNIIIIGSFEARCALYFDKHVKYLGVGNAMTQLLLKTAFDDAPLCLLQGAERGAFYDF